MENFPISFTTAGLGKQEEFLYFCVEAKGRTLMKAKEKGVEVVEKTKELIGLKIPVYSLLGERLYRHNDFVEIV